jgi:hypothetical protein
MRRRELRLDHIADAAGETVVVENITWDLVKVKDAGERESIAG